MDLQGFEAVQPALRRHADTLDPYRKNRHRALPPSRHQAITQAWRQSFEAWGYAA